MAKSEQLTLETRWKYPSRAPLCHVFLLLASSFITITVFSLSHTLAFYSASRSHSYSLALSLSLHATWSSPAAILSLSVTSIVFVDTLHCIRQHCQTDVCECCLFRERSSLSLSYTHTPQSQRKTFFVTVTSSNTIPLPLSFFLSHHFTSTTL